MRMQLAPAAGLAFLLAVWRLPWRQRIEAVVVAALVVLAIGMLDWITWSYPFESFVENFRTNIIEGKSHHFGVAPWYAYISAYVDLWGALGIAVLGLAVIGALRVPLYGVKELVIVVTHNPLARKPRQRSGQPLRLRHRAARRGAVARATRHERRHEAARRGSRGVRRRARRRALGDHGRLHVPPPRHPADHDQELVAADAARAVRERAARPPRSTKSARPVRARRVLGDRVSVSAARRLRA